MPKPKVQIPAPSQSMPPSVKVRIQALSRRLTAALNDAVHWEEQCYLRDQQITDLQAQLAARQPADA